MPTKVTIDASTGQRTEEEMTPEEVAALQSDPAELEAEVQALADKITQNGDTDRALALAMVDLVMAAVGGQLQGMDTATVRGRFRDRVMFYLRERRGL